VHFDAETMHFFSLENDTCFAL